VGARPSHVAGNKRAPTEGRAYKMGHHANLRFVSKEGYKGFKCK